MIPTNQCSSCRHIVSAGEFDEGRRCSGCAASAERLQTLQSDTEQPTQQPTDLGSTSGISPPAVDTVTVDDTNPLDAPVVPTDDETKAMAVLRPVLERVRRSDHWRKTDGKIHFCAGQPLTEKVLIGHLRSHFSAGACPIEQGSSTTRLALFDLDSHKGRTSWPEMADVARRLIAKGAEHGVRFIPFRSSGGNGVHLIAIWEGPQDAHSVRAFMSTILADCDLVSGTKGVAAGAVEIFPKQSRVDVDRAGSMFVLPLTMKSTALDPVAFESIDPGAVEWAMSEPVPFVETPALPIAAQQVIPGISKVREMLCSIDPNDYGDYERWRNLLFAVHHGTNGSAEGLQMFIAWSAGWNRFDPQKEPEEIKKYWESVQDRADGITVDTLKAAARKAGWVDPNETSSQGFSSATEERCSVAAAREVIGRAQRGAAEPARFAVTDADDFAADISAPAWIINDYIPAGGLTIIYGAPGSGKTFAVLDMAFAVARGQAWHGKKVRQMGVVYVAGEGGGGVRRRIHAYQKHHQVVGLPLGVIDDVPNLFTNDEDMKAVAENVKAYAERRGCPVGLVVLDTLAAVAPGMDENAVKDMTAVLRRANYIAAATGATVVVVHHANKSGAMRGSTALLGAADAVLAAGVDEEENSRRYQLVVQKQKDGEIGPRLVFTLQSVSLGVDEDMTPITSCVVVAVADAGTANASRMVRAGVRRLPRPGTMKRRVCDAVTHLTEDVPGREVEVERVVEHVETAISKGGSRPRRERVQKAVDGCVKTGILRLNEAGGGCSIETLMYPPRNSVAVEGQADRRAVL